MKMPRVAGRIELGLVDNACVRIFISSTRAGPEEERDSLPGLITARGHDPVLFEQFTAKAAPSRAACPSDHHDLESAD